MKIIYRIQVYRLTDNSPLWEKPAEYANFNSLLATVEMFPRERGWKVVYLGSSLASRSCAAAA